MDQAAHLTQEQLSGYQLRTLAAAELLAVDAHLLQCAACRERLAVIAAVVPGLEDLRFQLSEHLEYEQIVACAEGGGAPELRQHLEECALCRAEVADLAAFRRELAPVPAVVVSMPSRRGPSRWLGYAAIAAGIVAVVGLGVRRDRNVPVAAPVAGVTQPQPPAEAALPADQLAALERVRGTQQFEHAAVLDRLIAKRGVLLGAAGEGKSFGIEAPVGTTVLEDRPLFRWEAVPGATQYVVAVFDENFEKVAASPAVASPEWRPSEPLARGRVYNWQVTALVGGRSVRAPQPPAPEARFQITGADAVAGIETARRVHPANHLLLAVLLVQAGALDDAVAEVDALAASDPATARALRVNLDSLRKR